MNFITSISPNHNSFQSQELAIKSWLSLGAKVYSINHTSEIPLLQSQFEGVVFVQAEKTMSEIFGKHLIAIDSMIELANMLSDDIVCLINSDIELINNEGKFERMMTLAQSGICLVSRYNYDQDKKQNSIEKFGLDMFCFHKKFIPLIPKSIMSMGRPLWDYYIPYCLATYGIPIYSIHDRIAFHKKHPLQWNQDQWRLLSKEFRKLGHFEGIEDKKLSGQIRRIIISGIKQTVQEL